MKESKKRYLVLVVGTLALLFLGLIYAWSNFSKPLEAHFGWARSQTSNVFTLSIVTFCLGGLTGGILSRRLSAAWILRISSLCMVAGFLLSSRVTALWQIYLSYGVLCGFGVGLTYNAVLSTVVKWFGDKAAFCSGVLLMGFGTGGLILGTAAASVIASFGWSTAFLAIGIAGFAVLLAASFFIVPPEDAMSGAAKTAQAAGREMSPGQLLRSRNFWLLFIWGSVSSACGLSVINQGAPIAGSIGASAQLAALAVGTISVFNGLGRVIIGIVYPMIKRRTSMLVICCGYLLASAALLLAVNTGTLAFIFIGFAVVGLSYGSTPAFGVSIVREFFGPKHYSVNMSLFNLHLIVSAILGSSVVGLLVSNYENYQIGLIAGLALSALGLLLAPLAAKKPE